MCILPSAKSDSRYVNASNWTVQYRPQNNKRNLKKKNYGSSLVAKCWISLGSIVNTSYHTERIFKARPTSPDWYLHCSKSHTGIRRPWSLWYQGQRSVLSPATKPCKKREEWVDGLDTQRNKPQEVLPTRARVSFPSCPAVITAKQSFPKRSENGEALLRLKGDFWTAFGRNKAESRKMIFTESVYRQTYRGQHVALGEVGSKPCQRGRMGTGNVKKRWRRFSGATGGEQRTGKGNTVRPVCAGKCRTSESSQHSKAREKPFYTKSRLERGEVCLPVKTFMLRDRMKMAIPHRKYVKTLQDSHLGGFCLFFFFLDILTFRIWKERLILWLGKTGNGDKNYFKNMQFDLLA